MKKNILFLLTVISNIILINAQETVPISSINDVSEGTLLFRNDETSRYEIIPNLHTDVNINIKGMVSHTSVDQMFVNDSTEPIEAIYVFPLPPNSAINNMVMIVEDRIIQGKIKEKQEAKKQYEKAKKRGQRASLTEQQRPNIFTNKVANVMPNDTIIVRLEYVNELKYGNGNFDLRFPMVVGPRFIDGTRVTGYSGTGWAKDTDIVPDASQITPHVVPDGMRSGNIIDLSINIDAGIPIENVESSSHRIKISKENKNQYIVNLKNDKNIPNKDFSLSYKIKKGHEPKAALFTDTNHDENYFMLLAVPPLTSNDKIDIPKEVIFVVDVSGSMQGTSIKQAKNSLHYSIERLNNDDSFNIIAYSDHFFSMKKFPIEMNESNIDSAKEFINSLHAGGGTRAMGPLKEAMLMNTDTNKLKMIIFITDGDLGYEKDVFNLVNKYISNSRLFCVGIGSAPNGHLLEKVSEKGRGTYTYINNINHVNEKIKNLFDKIEMPVLTDVKLEIDGDYELFPNPLPDLFLNEPLVVFGKVNNKDKDNFKARFSGKTTDGYFKITLPVKFNKGIENSAVSDLWARKKIDRLMDDWYLGNKNVKEKIIEISINHNLISKFTSFVAVEDKIVNPNGKNIIANVKVDLPEGWVYESVFGKQFAKKKAVPYSKNKSIMASNDLKNNKLIPKTATNMPTYLLLGLISVLLSLTIFFINRKYEISKNI